MCLLRCKDFFELFLHAVYKETMIWQINEEKVH